jgi:TonB family protein
LSVFAHVLVLALGVALWHMSRVRIVPPKYTTVETISGAASVAFNPPPARSQPSPFHAKPRKQQAHVVEPGLGTTQTPGEILREHARQATAAIMTSIKFRQIYGFSPIDYELPVHMSGELPTISAAELPPRFQQFVVVEVTIDVDGHVAEARVTTGMVAPTIEQTLLAAIREFKYTPAKRDGTPIPSQLDIVVHIPT